MAPSLPPSVSALHPVGPGLQAHGHPSHIAKVPPHLLDTGDLDHPGSLGVSTSAARLIWRLVVTQKLVKNTESQVSRDQPSQMIVYLFIKSLGNLYANCSLKISALKWEFEEKGFHIFGLSDKYRLIFHCVWVH